MVYPANKGSAASLVFRDRPDFRETTACRVPSDHLEKRVVPDYPEGQDRRETKEKPRFCRRACVALQATRANRDFRDSRDVRERRDFSDLPVRRDCQERRGFRERRDRPDRWEVRVCRDTREREARLVEATKAKRALWD